MKIKDIGIQPRSGTILSTLFLAIPFIFDTMTGDRMFICPNYHHKYYSLLLICSPAVGAVLIAIAFSVQDYGNTGQTFSMRRALIRLSKRMIFTIIIVIFSFSAAFIYSDYFSCYMIGPGNMKDPEHKRRHIETLATSRQIGWYLIIFTFVVFIIGYVCVKWWFRPPVRDYILNKIQSQIKKKNKEKIDQMIDIAATKLVDQAYEESEKVIQLTSDLKNIAVYRYLENYRLYKKVENWHVPKIEPNDLKIHLKSEEEV